MTSRTPAIAQHRDDLPGWAWALIALAFVVAWFATLGTRSLIHPDEGRYAALSLSMLQSGDWVTPRLNGFLYFEKPAFQYWAGALSFLVFGVNEFAARLWPALSGLLTVAMVGFTGARLWDRATGIRAAALAGGCTWIVANSHFLTLDAGLTCFLTLTLCAVVLALRPGIGAQEQRRWVWAAWAGMALAVLSKGLVGIVIPGAVLVLHSLWQRDFSLWRRLHWISGLAVFLAICAPWFVLVSMRNPGFAEFFFIHEHFARYLTTEHRRVGAWWYFVPILVLGLMPWTSGLPWAFARRSAGAGTTAAHRMLVVWVAFVFLFFSASSSKLPSYILPVFPALALLIANAMRDASVRALRVHLLVPSALWLAIFVVATQASRFADASTPAEVLHSLGLALMAAAAVFVVTAALAWWLLGQGRTQAALAGVALAHLVATLIVMQAHNEFGQLKSADRFAAAIEPTVTPDTPFFAVGSYDQTLPFYLRRDVTLAAYVDEFAFGQERDPARHLPTLDAFLARWQALPRAAAYMDRDMLQTLRQQGFAYGKAFCDARRCVLVKP